jgi:hypothetical protein
MELDEDVMLCRALPFYVTLATGTYADTQTAPGRGPGAV